MPKWPFKPLKKVGMFVSHQKLFAVYIIPLIMYEHVSLYILEADMSSKVHVLT